MTWTDDRVALLKKLHKEGLSAGQIGKQMGVTRNAAIGKCHRLGLTRDDAETALNRHRGDQRARVTRTKTGADPWGKPLTAPRATPAPMPLQAAPSLDVKRFSISGNNKVMELGATQALPQERPHDGPVVALLNLGSCQCKFPIGTPGADEFGFCGKVRPAGEPYCDDHRRVCWRPVPASTQRRSDSQSEYLARRAR